MSTNRPGALVAAGKQKRTTNAQVLFVLCDEEQLCGVDLALDELSCEPLIVESISDALNLDLDQYYAIVLDSSSVNNRLSDTLDRFISRAPQASLLVACEASSRSAIITTLATCTAEWILKPIDGEELLGRLRHFETRRRVHVELEDSLYFIQRVADATPEMLFLFDVDDSYTVYVNRQLCSVLGCSPEGIRPEGFMFFKSVAHQDDLDRIAKYLDRRLATAKDGDVVRSEFRIRDRHHRWRWIHSREVVFHRDIEGRPKQILGTAQDVTDQKELEQTRSLLAAIVASSDDAIIGKTLHGEIISWNPAAEHMYGYTADEVIGRNISVLVPPKHQNEIPGLLNRIRRGLRVDHYETTRCCKDESRIRVSITISPILTREGKVTGASTITRRIPSQHAHIIAQDK